MYGFTDGDIVEKTELYTIWRVSEVVCIRVVGVVDDEKSERWRSGLTSYLERTGYPRFAALDSTGSDAQNSLRSRLSSATFGRNLARRLEWGAVLTGSGSGPLVVVRTVLRVGGMPNVYIYQSVPEFTAAMDACRAGRRPPRWSSLQVEA
jgi:hypothetical protein